MSAIASAIEAPGLETCQTRGCLERIGAASIERVATRFAPPVGLPSRAAVVQNVSMSSPGTDPTSYWWAEPPAPFPALQEEIDADVLIVGGGVAGITLAFTLVEQGAVVALIEAGPLAGSASGRNAGFLMAASADPYKDEIEFWGRGVARAILETGRRSHQRVSELVESLGLQCDYRRGGSLRLARTEEEAEDQRASLPLLHADGFTMRELPVSEAVPDHAAKHFVAAFVSPEDGEIHPVRFLHGLARAAEVKGARLFGHSALRAARWSGGLWTAETERGHARARTLVLCTNAFTPQLCPALRELIVPRRGQMLATAPLEREIASRPVYAHWGYQYWRQTPDRRLLIGGWRDLDFEGESGYEDRPSDRIQRGIEEGLARLVPGGAPIEHRWAGIMGFARDGRPLVGWLDAAHHLAICGGFTGHGMGMAAACTLELADLLSWKRAPGISNYDPGRFAELRQGRDGFVALGVAASR
jgi:glycine/D-amino acid oxidase-like deaminating enzyme